MVCGPGCATPYKESMKTKRNAQLSLQKLDIQTDSVCYVRMYVRCIHIVYTDRHIHRVCNRYRRGLPKTKNTEANLAEPEDIRRGASRIFLYVCCCFVFMVLLFHIIAHFVLTQDQVFFGFLFFTFILISLFILHFVHTKTKTCCVIFLSLCLCFFVDVVVFKLVLLLPSLSLSNLFIQLTSRTRFPFRRIQIWVSLDKQSLSTCPILGSVCDCGSFP